MLVVNHQNTFKFSVSNDFNSKTNCGNKQSDMCLPTEIFYRGQSGQNMTIKSFKSNDSIIIMTAFT